jgi:hypothetical protein
MVNNKIKYPAKKIFLTTSEIHDIPKNSNKIRNYNIIFSHWGQRCVTRMTVIDSIFEKRFKISAYFSCKKC